MRIAPDVSARPLEELVSLRGRVAVVTGAAQGIGLAIARRLSEAGAAVVLGDIDADAVKDAAAGVGAGATATVVDVTDSGSVVALAEIAVRQHRRLDIWVNNAGIYPSHPILEATDADWDAVLDVDLRRVFVGAREGARRMVESGTGGVVVNVASTAAYRVAGAGISHYAAAKHGVLGLTKSLAVELGPHGVRVLAVAPAVTRTPGIENARPALERAGFALDDLAATLPLGRIAVPDDVARVVLFCASDLAVLMTGSTLLVDAGWVAT